MQNNLLLLEIKYKNAGNKIQKCKILMINNSDKKGSCIDLLYYI